MRIIDLTQTFTNDMPVFPGDPKSSLKQIFNVDKDGFSNFALSTNMHVGTHIDGPLHMLSDMTTIDNQSINAFIGRGVLINAFEREFIDENLLQGTSFKAGDIALIYTGWDKYYKTDKYFKNTPRITQAFANQLVEAKVKMVCMDISGPDEGDGQYSVHKIFLGNNTLVAENLTSLEKLVGIKNFEVIALPLKLKADSAPCRIIARAME